MAVAQDAAAIFAIKQANEKVSIWEVNWGRSHIVAAAAGTDKAAPFVKYTYI